MLLKYKKENNDKPNKNKQTRTRKQQQQQPYKNTISHFEKNGMGCGWRMTPPVKEGTQNNRSRICWQCCYNVSKLVRSRPTNTRLDKKHCRTCLMGISNWAQFARRLRVEHGFFSSIWCMIIIILLKRRQNRWPGLTCRTSAAGLWVGRIWRVLLEKLTTSAISPLTE